MPLVVSKLHVALWLCARGSFLVWPQEAGLAPAATFIVVLTLFAAAYVIRGRDRRNLKVLFLLFTYCGSAILTAASFQTEFALRLALASIVGLVMVIGGRVVPALTGAFILSAGGGGAPRSSVIAERVSAVAATCALCGWTVAPQSRFTAYACLLAACMQMVRVAQWGGWRNHLPASVVALHVGYGWIVAGFAFLAGHIFVPASIGLPAAIHAWTIGAIGTMSLAIMASMIRKHSGRAFAPSTPMAAGFVAMTGSALSRLLTEMSPAATAPWTAISGILWAVAFCLFLATFHRTLLARE